LQAPAPSQVEGGVALPDVQLAGAQTVPAAYLRQAPEPLQAPSFAQPAAPWSLHVPAGSAPPAGTATHTPVEPGSAQDMQDPVQAVEQQTPCWQWPLMQSLPSPQSCPAGFFPHEPFWQLALLAQSASLAQLVAQRTPLHLNGAHDCPAGGTHCPWPSQVNGPV
jgi:hypothetical protein